MINGNSIKLPEKLRITDQSDQYLLTRKVLLSGEVDETAVQDITRKFFLLQEIDDEKPITLIIDSEGGEVYHGLHIYDLIKAIKCDVNVVVMGMAMSAAFIIALAGRDRRITPNATMMMHEISSIAIGKTSDIEDNLKECKRLEKVLWAIVKARTRLSPREMGKFKRQDVYFSSTDAVEKGIVDGIVEEI